MGWLVLGLRPAVENAACTVTQKRYGNTARSQNVLRTLMAEVRPKRRYAHEGAHRVDPHKASVAVAVVDEAKGELLERASFPQNRAGLRALERFKRNGSPSVVRP
jgi:hypothetical protein